MNTIDTKPCQISPQQLRLISDYMAQYGITEFFYGITTKSRMPQGIDFKKLSRRVPNEMQKAQYSVFSSEKIRRFRHDYLQSFARIDAGYQEKNVMGLNIWRDPDYSGGKGAQFRKLMEQYGLNSRGVWYFPVKYHSDWTAVFVFFSSLERNELTQILNDNMEEINAQLQLFSSSLNEQFITQINPITNFNCLSDKSLQVLALTAEGYACDEISQKLKLSESGVNYHLTRLKELFHAKNRAQLVNLAHTLGVLD
ncbi:helix-turn-helix transcriptional regulator [Shewanella atlantica]|uniref:LuxR family transcriptional regulator n=1 Tax=Shewanella atlantica TaxID=271099 RepID=A0A431WE47_9GAMM|nr:helix-turn-helix transcriptional regulator [Shewanella atlantica]RTR33598.1 LuxR family transcriptional regulator [Shewanella atlantica]